METVKCEWNGSVMVQLFVVMAMSGLSDSMGSPALWNSFKRMSGFVEFNPQPRDLDAAGNRQQLTL